MEVLIEDKLSQNAQVLQYVQVTKPELRKKRLHMPKTAEDRIDLGVRELRVPATWEEYLGVLEVADFPLHYREGHIISFLEIEEKTNTIMGFATIPHEELVMRFGRFLDELLENYSNPKYKVVGSNTVIFIKDDQKGYNSDVTVIKGTPIEKHYKYNKRNIKGLVNPWLIVEILSNGTRDFDLSEKLEDYKLIPDLQQVIFAEQGKCWVSTYIRVSQNEWRNLNFHTIEEQIPVADGFLSMKKIFRDIF
jgi:Uma2 family endonuclease